MDTYITIVKKNQIICTTILVQTCENLPNSTQFESKSSILANISIKNLPQILTHNVVVKNNLQPVEVNLINIWQMFNLGIVLHKFDTSLSLIHQLIRIPFQICLSITFLSWLQCNAAKYYVVRSGCFVLYCLGFVFECDQISSWRSCDTSYSLDHIVDLR